MHCIFCLRFEALGRMVAAMNVSVEFRRRLGTDTHAANALCVGCDGCPDIWELESGDFAVIGVDITAAAKATLPASAGCGPGERIILLPRNLLVNAKRDIPDRI